jgi:hypothetical protein
MAFIIGVTASLARRVPEYAPPFNWVAWHRRTMPV